MKKIFFRGKEKAGAAAPPGLFNSTADHKRYDTYGPAKIIIFPSFRKKSVDKFRELFDLLYKGIHPRIEYLTIKQQVKKMIKRIKMDKISRDFVRSIKKGDTYIIEFPDYRALDSARNIVTQTRKFDNVPLYGKVRSAEKTLTILHANDFWTDMFGDRL